MQRCRKFYAIVAALIALSIAASWFSLCAFLAVNRPFYVVPSESMVPNLNVGDVVMVRNGAGFSFDDLKVGDIIVFHTDDGGGRTIVHRIVQVYVDADTSERLVKTKGDNNPKSYEGFDYPVRKADYYGKVVLVIPQVGILSTILNTSEGPR